VAGAATTAEDVSVVDVCSVGTSLVEISGTGEVGNGAAGGGVHAGLTVGALNGGIWVTGGSVGIGGRG